MSRRSNKRRRSRYFIVRFTEEEFNAVTAMAAKAGLAAAFTSADDKTLRQILGQLGRVGNDLDQIARALNAGEQASLPDLPAALRAYLEIHKAILEALGKKPGPDP
jgi:hypothetical protein